MTLPAPCLCRFAGLSAPLAGAGRRISASAALTSASSIVHGVTLIQVDGFLSDKMIVTSLIFHSLLILHNLKNHGKTETAGVPLYLPSISVSGTGIHIQPLSPIREPPELPVCLRYS